MGNIRPVGTQLGAVTATLGGFTAGVVHPSGANVHLNQLTGWWDPPASSGTAEQRQSDHGGWLTPAYYAPRVIGLTAKIDADSPAVALQVAGELMGAVSLDELEELAITDEVGTLTARVRQEGDPLLSRSGARCTVSLSLLAPDPRRYGPQAAVATGLPTTTGGLSLPVVLPISLGATMATGEVSINHAGNMPAPMLLAVAGSCPPFTITHLQSARAIASLEAVPAGRTLVLDTAARTALLDGVAPRTVVGSWPELTPGLNTLRFTAAAYDAAAQLTVTYRPAWK